MGFNSTVIVMNDALGSIEKDKDFGRKLSDGIRDLYSRRKPTDLVDVSAGGYVNAASVIEQHHADSTAIIAVGGNYGTVLGHYWSYSHHEPASQLNILKHLASEMGYRLVKK